MKYLYLGEGPDVHEVEAVQYHGPNFDEIEEFVGGDAEVRDGCLLVATPGGALYADPGDWIVKDAAGFYAVKPDTFRDMYQGIS